MLAIPATSLSKPSQPKFAQRPGPIQADSAHFFLRVETIKLQIPSQEIPEFWGFRCRGTVHNFKDNMSGGPSRNRTGVRGFAVLYVTTPPSGLGHRLKQKYALSVVQRGANSCTVAVMQCCDAIHKVKISISSESCLAFMPTPSRSCASKTVLLMQHGSAISLQAMGFMTLLPQSEEMRRNMVDSQLRTSGVNTPWILAAMLAAPREAFVTGDGSSAYMDRSVPLGAGRMLNPPLAAGQMLQLAEIVPHDRVLLVGAGTGYLAALIAGRVKTLVAVEEAAALADQFASNLPMATLVRGPLSAGAPEYAPYTLILIDGSIEILPDALADQLADGGRIVAGTKDGLVTRLSIGIKRGAHLALRPVADMEIAPLPGFDRIKEFVF